MIASPDIKVRKSGLIAVWAAVKSKRVELDQIETAERHRLALPSEGAYDPSPGTG